MSEADEAAPTATDADGVGATSRWPSVDVRIVDVEVDKPTYRYKGALTVEEKVEQGSEGGRTWRLPMTGTIAQWAIPGHEYRLELRHRRLRSPGFDDHRLFRRTLVWPPYDVPWVHERPSPVTGAPLYAYQLRVREARFEKDYDAIVDLEQYHYASEEELLARWWCPACDRYVDANARPSCPDCGGPTRFHDLISATRASRFLVVELADRAAWEPEIVAYVRIDPPLPAMNRRLPDGTIVRDIRRQVFPSRWFDHPFAPVAQPDEDRWEAQERWLRIVRSPVSRLARVVVHPDFRVDGLGQAAVEAAVDWVRRRWIPEMRVRKEAIEVVAQMARYNPFLERVGFRYLWDTGSGRPVLYRALSERAEEAIARFLADDPVAREHGGRLYRPRWRPAEPPSGPIRLDGVTKRYTNRLGLEDVPEDVAEALRAFGVESRVITKLVLRDATVAFEPGTVSVVHGASGSGKTTLLRLVVGAAEGSDDDLHRPDEGTVEVPPDARLAVEIPGEREPSFGDGPILAEVAARCGDAATAIEILNLAGISDAVLYRAPFGELSTGQRQRARLAALLADRPNVLLVDEFAAHLDPTAAMRLARRVSSLVREHAMAAVLVTHRVEVVGAAEPDQRVLVGYGTVAVLDREATLPDRALIVREPFASLIVSGEKVWEIRKHPTRVRGRIGIANRGRLLGTVEIVGTEGPFSAEELARHRGLHRADPEMLARYADGKPLWAWVLADPHRFDRPVRIGTKRGQQMWITVEPPTVGTGTAVDTPKAEDAQTVTDAQATAEAQTGRADATEDRGGAADPRTDER